MVSCCICNSWRGAAYFVTSVQVFLGLYYFLKWSLITFVNGNHIEYFQDSRQRVLYPLLLIYLTLLVLLGSINFLAVQKESGKVLKWTTRLLLILQLVQLLTHLLLGVWLPDHENDDPAGSLTWHMQRLTLSLIASVVYFVVLFVYCKTLINGSYLVGMSKKEKNFEIEERYYDPPAKLPLDNRKKKRRNKGSDEEEAEATSSLHPSAPPPTPGPSQNEGEDDPRALTPADADAYVDYIEEGGNVYVAGPDKKEYS